jgi:anti-sigma regulatory factor (Ser/Thr protein kinase)
VFHAEPARLPEGGVLVLYTDGLIERRTESLNDGLDRLATGVAGTPLDDDLERFADTIATEVATDGSSDDDIALLLVRRTVAHDHFQTVIEARAERLASIRTDLRRWLEYIGCSEPVAADLVLAIGECAANVVEHAYPPGVTGPLEINADVSPDTSPDGGGLAEIIVEIRDHGRWRAPRDVGGGRGHDMLRQLVDEAHFDSGDDGTAVALTRRVELAAPASV